MSDIEVMRQMLERAGVKYTEEWNEKKGERTLSCEETGLDEGPNRGYNGFVAVFYFDATGKLVAVGAWE